MTLLNILFGNKKRRAVDEFLFHANQRMRLWKQHLNYFEARHSLVRFFKYNEVDNALNNFDKLLDVLRRIELSISQDLVNIKDEEKNEQAILSDLNSLTSRDSLEHTDTLTAQAARTYYKKENLIEVFKKLYETLQLELHTINLIRSKPQNVLLIRLFDLIFYQEYRLTKPFIGEHYTDVSMHTDVEKVASSLLLEKEFDEKIAFAEKKIVQDMEAIMGDSKSIHDYRLLAKSLLDRLVDKASDDTKFASEIVDKIVVLLDNTRLLRSMIVSLRPNYSAEDVDRIIQAFRKTCTTNLLIDFELS